MTREQARAKQCCGPENCGDHGHKVRTCNTTACMAWHEVESSQFIQNAEYTYRQSGRREVPKDADMVGYCGFDGARL